MISGADGTFFYRKRSKKDTEETHVLSYFIPSWNGKYVAYGMTADGSENTTPYILLNTQTLERIDQPISKVTYKNYGFWLPDGRAFFYTRGQIMPAGTPETKRYKKAKPVC